MLPRPTALLACTFLTAAAGATAAASLNTSCVPAGNAPPFDAGAPAPTTTMRPSFNVMTQPFEDGFDRPDASWRELPTDLLPEKDVAVRTDGGPDAGALLAASSDAGRPVTGPSLGPNWLQAKTNAWRIEDGRLCAQNARNHGIWLNKVLPLNARIEFDAMSSSDEGDLKAEVWGDGKSGATAVSYTNATSYLAILGGWKNSIHALARLNEHGKDRKEIPVDKESDDPRQRPVQKGQVYRFKIERTDGKTVRWFVDGVEMLSFVDSEPLGGEGHDHFGFNEWEVKTCYDNVRVTPL